MELNLISLRLFEKIGDILLENNITDKKLIDNDRRYMDIATDGKSISYIREDRLDKFEGDFWNEELRRRFATQTRPTRIMSLLLGSMDSTMIGRIKNAMGEGNGLDIRVVRGTEIAKYYNGDYYGDNSGTLGKSCMRDKPASFFSFYAEELEMVVLIDQEIDKIYARALMFRNVRSMNDYPNIDTLLSRIYYTDNETYRYMIEQWALDKGYFIVDGGYDAIDMYSKDKEYRLCEYKPYYITTETSPVNFNQVAFIDNFGDCLTSEWSSTAYMFFDADDAYEFMNKRLSDTDFEIHDYRDTYGGYRTLFDGSYSEDCCSGCNMVCAECCMGDLD